MGAQRRRAKALRCRAPQRPQMKKKTTNLSLIYDHCLATQHPWVWLTQQQLEVEMKSTRARGRRRVSSPGAAARHSHSDKIQTCNRRTVVAFPCIVICPIFFWFFFWVFQHFFPKTSQIHHHPRFCHLPDFPNWPVPTASSEQSLQANVDNLGMTK